MRNVDLTVNEGVLTISIRLDTPGLASASGKTSVLATTEGNTVVPGTDLRLSLNLWRRPR